MTAALFALVVVLCIAVMVMWMRHPKQQARLAEIIMVLSDIVDQYNERITLLERQEKAHKRLLTGLSHDLKRLTDMLFDWFKLDAQEMSFSFETLDLCELTRAVAADFIPVLEKNGIDYRVIIPEGELLCRLDAQAYTRLLGNLLQNAITHSGGSTVELMVWGEGDRASVSVQDDGIGIGEEELPFIFDRLYKGDPARTGKSSGLGLSITKALVKAHGGTIEATGIKGQGCTFTLHLPRKS